MSHRPTTRIIAHRGASGLLPEHTLAGYRLAIDQGADLIEPDLVVTRDGVLLARHDRGLARSTDIATRPHFAGRARRLDDGSHDWWVDDFDWAELAELRAIQPFPGRDRSEDGRHPIPTFAEVLDVAAEGSRRSGRRISVYPEIKHPALFTALGIDPTARFIELLAARGLTGPACGVWFQCFESEPIDRVQAALGLPGFELFEASRVDAPGFLADVERCRARGRSGIALPKRALIDAAGHDTGHTRRAHALGLAMHTWTFRDDQPNPPFATPIEEYAAFFALGVDALFSDFPATAVAARDA
jgi:glycerophosphoryl diester phosphodiesterase